MAELQQRASRYWKTWRQRTWIERCRLTQALIFLPLVSVGLRLLGFRRLQRLLERGMPKEVVSKKRASTGNDLVLTECRNIAKMVDIAAGHSPIAATCLQRSLVLWWLLGREGFASDLRLGAKKAEDLFEAHAWVEYDGFVLNDSEDVQQRFATFDPNLTELS